MSLYPHARLLRALASWTAFSIVLSALPWLWPAAVAALAILLALVLWDASMLRALPGVVCERSLPERLFVGRAADVVLVLRNPGASAREVDIAEDLPQQLDWLGPGDTSSTPEEAATQRALPAAGGLPLAAARRASPSFHRVPIDAESTTTVRYTVHPRRRGDARLGPVLVLERSPLGLLRRRSAHATSDVARVYPDVSRYLRPEALHPELVFRAIGVRPQRQRGEGMEFESLRDYVPGDDPRRIAWSPSARRGRAVTRLTQHEKHHTVYICVDTSRLMAGKVEDRNKLDFATDAALALAYGVLVSGDRLGMAIFDDEVRGALSPRSHKRELGRYVELLRQADVRLVEANYAALAATLAVQQRQRALVVVLTDFVDADPLAFRAPLVVLGKRHRVLLVALRDRVYRALETPRRSEPLDLYRRLVLNDLLREREQTLLALRRAGVQTLDLPPEEITAAVLNRYLALRRGPDW